jgi:hypothetical protein
MELITKVEETERANLSEGQEAIVRLDALPKRVVTAKIKRLGNTASSNVFRGEATKKFECVLSIDMRQLLENVGAKPEQVERILATAKQNAASGVGGGRRPPLGQALAFGGPPGGGDGESQGQGGDGQRAGRRRGGQGGGQGGGQQPGGSPGAAPQAGVENAQRKGGQGGGGFDREQFQKLVKEISGKELSELSQEERQTVMQQARQRMGGGAGRTGGARGGAGGPGSAGPGAAGGALIPPPLEGGAAGAGGGAGGGGGDQQFSAEQRANAQLPAPPEQGSDVDILLRPGLLADAEIIVEKIPDAVHIPFQGVFEVDGKPTVFVQKGDNRFELRHVELGKRSESQITIRSGLEEGELIALTAPPEFADRFAQTTKAAKKAGSRGQAGGGPGLPGGGGGGGGPQGGGGRQGPR